VFQDGRPCQSRCPTLIELGVLCTQDREEADHTHIRVYGQPPPSPGAGTPKGQTNPSELAQTRPVAIEEGQDFQADLDGA